MNLFGYDFYIFRSLQSKIFILVSILTLLLSIMKYKSVKVIVIQVILYIIVSREIDCYIYGGCNSAGWFRVLLPILIFVIILLDHFKLYDLTKILKAAIYYIEKANVSEKRGFVINN